MKRRIWPWVLGMLVVGIALGFALGFRYGVVRSRVEPPATWQLEGEIPDTTGLLQISTTAEDGWEWSAPAYRYTETRGGKTYEYTSTPCGNMQIPASCNDQISLFRASFGAESTATADGEPLEGEKYAHKLQYRNVQIYLDGGENILFQAVRFNQADGEAFGGFFPKDAGPVWLELADQAVRSQPVLTGADAFAAGDGDSAARIVMTWDVYTDKGEFLESGGVYLDQTVSCTTGR